jgi:phosphoglycolate phosphatase
MLSRLAAVVFDFDYTLADSTEGAVESIRYALDALGLPPASHDDAARTIGLSLPEVLVALTGPANAHLAAEFSRLFVERADEIMVDGTRLYPGVDRTLAVLRGMGLRLGIVSTKYRYRIEATLTRDGLIDAVDAIVGGEDVSAVKPAPEGLHTALERLEVKATRVLYVGDSLTDARAARAAELAFVAVLSGTTPAEAFTPWQPLAVLSDVNSLPDVIQERL